jgi:uncharacterized protein YbjT (DUF2867 family)
MPALRALIAGSTGLVGRACLDTLAVHPAYDRVVALVRRPSGRTSSRVIEQVVSFDRLDEEPAVAADHAFCALGTTIRTAGSEEGFRRVDLGMVASFAAYARRSGAATFVLVSSVGANASSRTLYLRVKGEAEHAVATQGFTRFHVLRPGVLIGSRAEVRRAEAVAQAIAPALGLLLQGPLRQYRGIAAATVGAAMVGTALAGGIGTAVLHYDAIIDAAGLAARQEEA